jgi:hypothetical protein
MRIAQAEPGGGLTLVEGAGRWRLFGAALLCGGLIGVWLPLEVEPGGRIAAGVAALVGAGMMLFAPSRRISLDARRSVLRIETRNGPLARAETLPARQIARIVLRRHWFESAGEATSSPDRFELVAETADGRQVGLSADTSWGRDEKRAAGRALAGMLGVPYADL